MSKVHKIVSVVFFEMFHTGSCACRGRKFKSLEMSPVGYDAFYAISASGMNVETEFTVAEDASVAQVRKAFRDNLKKKTTNKKLLSSFAALVA